MEEEEKGGRGGNKRGWEEFLHLDNGKILLEFCNNL